MALLRRRHPSLPKLLTSRFVINESLGSRSELSLALSLRSRLQACIAEYDRVLFNSAEDTASVDAEIGFLGTAAGAFDFLAVIYLEDDVEALFDGLRDLIVRYIGLDADLRHIVGQPDDCVLIKTHILNSATDKLLKIVSNSQDARYRRICEIVEMLKTPAAAAARAATCRVYAQDEPEECWAEIFLMLGGDYPCIVRHSTEWHVALHAALTYSVLEFAQRSEAGACVTELLEIWAETPRDAPSLFYHLIFCLLCESVSDIQQLELDPWLHAHLFLFYACLGMLHLLKIENVELYFLQHAVSLGTNHPNGLQLAKAYLSPCQAGTKMLSSLLVFAIEAANTAAEVEIFFNESHSDRKVIDAVVSRARRFANTGEEDFAVRLMLQVPDDVGEEVKAIVQGIITGIITTGENQWLEKASKTVGAAGRSSADITLLREFVEYLASAKTPGRREKEATKRLASILSYEQMPGNVIAHLYAGFVELAQESEVEARLEDLLTILRSISRLDEGDIELQRKAREQCLFRVSRILAS